jgi:1-acyl-sn-glycerol-3-phosphate acyltransferase
MSVFFTTLYTCIATLTNGLSLYFMLIWTPLGFLTSAILMALYLLFLIYVLFPILKPGSILLQKLTYPFIKFVNILARIKIEVVGYENIPSETFVIYANHKSMLDITIIYEALNRPVSAIAKKELAEVPVLKTLIKDLYVQTVDRENDMAAVKSLVKAMKYVKEGLPYFIFPEGGIKTRETELMTSLRPGAYKLATKPGATILPVSIIGSSKLAKNSFKKHTDIKVIFHKPINKEEYSEKFINEEISKEVNTKELGKYVQDIIDRGVLSENK